jgi:hypothetical protein
MISCEIRLSPISVVKISLHTARSALAEAESDSGAYSHIVLAVARRCSPSILARIMSLKHPGKCETKAV